MAAAFDARAIITGGAFPSATFGTEAWGRAKLTRAWAVDLAEAEKIGLFAELVTDRIEALRDTLSVVAERVSQIIGIERVR